MKNPGIVTSCLAVIFFNAYKTNAAWHIAVTDGEDFTGMHTSLALDSADTVHISYRGGSYLKYANNTSVTITNLRWW